MSFVHESYRGIPDSVGHMPVLQCCLMTSMYSQIVRLPLLLLWAVAIAIATGCDSAGEAPAPTAVELVAPVLAYPTDGLTTAPTTAVMTWNPVEHARSYEVEWSMSDGTDFSDTSTSETDGLTLLLPDIPVGQNVQWRVRALRSTDSGPWSTWFRFTALVPPRVLPPPALTLPANGQAGMEPWADLRWEPVPGALSYHVQVTIDEEMILFQADTEGLQEPGMDLSALIYTYPYWWKVRTLGPSGYSDWSPVWIFWIRDQP